jgi:hypothetical protein
VLNSWMHRSKLQYLVKWEGYPASEVTWEPEGNLWNALQLVQDFHRKNLKAINPWKINKSIFTTPDFLEFWKKFIHPYIAFGNSWDTCPKQGVMSQMPPKTPKSPFTIPLVPTTCITPTTEDEDTFYDCL